MAKAAVSHWWYRAEPVTLGWNKEYARELFSYSRWIIGSTMVSFVAQQFHVLYLGKFLPLRRWACTSSRGTSARRPRSRSPRSPTA
jgi:O-antigen/teichoic acid export membrane protein